MNKNIFCFKDQNPFLHNKSYDNVPILPHYFNMETVIICSENLFEEIYQKYIDLGAKPENIKLYTEYGLDFQNKDVASQVLLDEFRELRPFSYECKNINDGYIFIKRLRKQGTEKQILDAVAIDVTRRCTLNCESCLCLTPYVEKFDCNLEATIQSIEILINAAGFINRIEIMGGEPLLYKNLPSLLQKVKPLLDSIGSIYIVTNGTIVPDIDVIHAAKRLNANFIISNYGELSTKLNDVCAVLHQYKMLFYIDYRKSWYQYGLLRNQQMDAKLAVEQRKRCKNNCLNIFNNSLSFCQFLSAFPYIKGSKADETDRLDLSRPIDKDTLINYLTADYPSCKFCTGWPDFNPIGSIPPALQAER